MEVVYALHGQHTRSLYTQMHTVKTSKQWNVSTMHDTPEGTPTREAHSNRQRQSVCASMYVFGGFFVLVISRRFDLPFNLFYVILVNNAVIFD